MYLMIVYIKKSLFKGDHAEIPIIENIIFLNDEATEVNSLLKTEQEKTDSSSEGEFSECLDNVRKKHEYNVHVDDKPNTINTSTNVSESSAKTISACGLNKNLLESLKADMKIIENRLNKQIYNKVLSETTSNRTNQNRGGKYNKRAAPAPPSDENEKSDKNITIKATLVLKPGVVKPIGPTSTEDASRTEVFLSSSPKMKRRLNRTPSPSKTRTDTALNKLMVLSKKIGLGTKNPDYDISKRKSWHDIFYGSPKLTRQTSKSDNDFLKNNQDSATKETENKGMDNGCLYAN